MGQQVAGSTGCRVMGQRVNGSPGRRVAGSPGCQAVGRWLKYRDVPLSCDRILTSIGLLNRFGVSFSIGLDFGQRKYANIFLCPKSKKIKVLGVLFWRDRPLSLPCHSTTPLPARYWGILL
jgi:hypothetical protein